MSPIPFLGSCRLVKSYPQSLRTDRQTYAHTQIFARRCVPYSCRRCVLWAALPVGAPTTSRHLSVKCEIIFNVHYRSASTLTSTFNIVSMSGTRNELEPTHRVNVNCTTGTLLRLLYTKRQWLIWSFSINAWVISDQLGLQPNFGTTHLVY